MADNNHSEVSAGEGSPVFYMDSEDAAMQAVVSQAQSTFQFFWREAYWEKRRIVPALVVSSVKAPFSDEEMTMTSDAPVEHMWVTDIEFDGETIYGNLNSDPNDVTSVKAGDAVQLPIAGISDWLYGLGGKAYGGFTINLMRSQMSADEREVHDNAWGLDFGSPDSVELSEYEGEHPVSVVMSESIEEYIKQDPASVTVAGSNDLTLLHDFTLIGSSEGVEIALKYGADVNAKTATGKTPLALANQMGWDNVTEILTAAGGQN